MPINIKLLEKVRDHILEEPKRLNMGHWLVKKKANAQKFSDLTKAKGAPACNTVGCIAGWAVVIAKKQKELQKSELNVEECASKLLGLTFEDGSRNWGMNDRLFQANSWPESFSDALSQHKPGTKVYAEVVARRINHFIKTNGAA